jgi:GntR family transcriptional regulator
VTAPGGRAPDDGVRDRQRQIAADLRIEILSGQIRTGEALPTTAVLMERYGVKNQTVQRAIAILKREGLVDSRRGSGVYASARVPTVVEASHYPRPAENGDRYPWVSEAARRDRAISTRLLGVAEEPAPNQVAAALGVEAAAPVQVRRLVLLLNDEPAELVTNYYPVDIARGTPLAANRVMKGGSPRALTDLGYPPGRAVDDVGATLATVEEFIHLKLPEDMPVLRQFRVVYAADGRPIEVTEMVKAAHKYKSRYHLPGPG